MAERRKLQAEIEKCFKKVDEGIEIFEEMLKKSLEVGDHHREKLQDDLKKEIKKLQRLRESIKNWQTCSDIKDKERLNHYRTLIEERMETFKEIEREAKTKPHSTIGLTIENKVDPKDKEKDEVCEWMNGQLRQIRDELDRAESRYECPNEGGRKRGKGAAKLTPQQEELKAYIEHIKFNILNLEVCMRCIDNNKLEASYVVEQLKEPLEQYVEALSPDNDFDPADFAVDDIYEQLDLSTYLNQITTTPAPTIVKPPPSPPPTTPSAVSTKPPPVRVEPPPPRTEAPSRIEAPSRTEPPPRNEPPSRTEPPSRNEPLPRNEPPPRTEASSRNETPPSEQLSSRIAAPRPKAADAPPSALATASPFVPSVAPPSAPPSFAPPSSAPPSSAPPSSAPPSSAPPSSAPPSSAPPSSAPPPSAPPPSAPPPSALSAVTKTPPTTTLPPTATAAAPKTTDKGDRVQIPPYFGLCPLRQRARTDKIKPEIEAGLESAATAVSALETRMCPYNHYPRRQAEVPRHYPKELLPHFNDVFVYTQFELSTLFYIFYYMEGSRAQLLAAAALKRLAWRFHTRYHMWFQRERNPDEINDRHERGSFIYFDYAKWTTCTKHNFIFDYKFLEDRPLEEMKTPQLDDVVVAARHFLPLCHYINRCTIQNVSLIGNVLMLDAD